MEGIQYPGTHDVMCGRGGHSTCHPGNLRFRQLVAMYRERYTSSQRHEKTQVATEVLQQWRNQTPPGRLLKRTDFEQGDNSPWSDIGNLEGRKKVAQTLREKERNPSMDPSYLPSALASTIPHAEPAMTTLPTMVPMAAAAAGATVVGGWVPPSFSQCFNMPVPVTTTNPARMPLVPQMQQSNPLQFFFPPLLPLPNIATNVITQAASGTLPAAVKPAAVVVAPNSRPSGSFGCNPVVQAVVLTTRSTAATTTIKPNEPPPPQTTMTVIVEDERSVKNQGGSNLVLPSTISTSSSSSSRKRSRSKYHQEDDGEDKEEEAARRRRRRRRRRERQAKEERRRLKKSSSRRTDLLDGGVGGGDLGFSRDMFFEDSYQNIEERFNDGKDLLDDADGLAAGSLFAEEGTMVSQSSDQSLTGNEGQHQSANP